VTPGHRCTKWYTSAFNLWVSNVVSPGDGPAERSMTTTNSKESANHSRVTLTTDKSSSISTDTDTISYTMARRTPYGCAGPTKISITIKFCYKPWSKAWVQMEVFCACYCLDKSGGNSLVWNRYTFIIYIEWYTSFDVQEDRLF